MDRWAVGWAARENLQAAHTFPLSLGSSLSDLAIVLQCSHREASGPAVKKILQMHRINQVIAQTHLQHNLLFTNFRLDLYLFGSVFVAWVLLSSD
jgi:hypothetical protein